MRLALIVALAIVAPGLSADGLRLPTFTPENDFIYRLDFPDGTEKLFFRPDVNLDNLIGEDGWGATLSRRSATVFSPSGKKPQEVYEFNKGELKSFLRNGLHTAYAPTGTLVDATFEDIFADDSEMLREEIVASRSELWRESGRMRFLYQNPNKTAVLMVYALLLGIVLLCCRPKSRVWIARTVGAVIVLLSGVGIVLTSSRGGMLAAACATAFVAVSKVFRRCRSRWMAFALLIFAAIVVCAVMSFGPIGRAIEGKIASDPGLQHRNEVLKAVPRMIADAPDGWGYGRSGAAYINWYQNIEVIYPRRTLVSSHATILAECGSACRIMYVFVWIFAILLLLDYAACGKASFALGSVLVLFIAASFNPVLEEWTIWCLPAVLFAINLVRFAKERGVLRVATYAAVALLASWFVITFLQSCGKKPAYEVGVKFADGRLVVNGDTPKTWVVRDQKVLGGEMFLGRCVRSYYEENPDAPALAIVDSVDRLPKEVDRLALAGRSATEYFRCWRDESLRKDLCRAKSILLLSPACTIDGVPNDLLGEARLRAVCGSLAISRLPADKRAVPDWVRVIPGVLAYVPDWTKLVLTF